MNLELYAYGNGDILISTLNAIAMLLGSNMYATAMLVTGLAALVYVLVHGVFSANKAFDWVWFIGFAFVVNVLFVPKVNLLVIDQNGQFVNPGPPPLVSNIPLGLGVMAHFASVAGKSMTDLMETAFADPAGMSYSQNGLGFSQNALSTSTQQYFQPGQFRSDMDSYIQTCVIMDILSGATSAATLANAPDLWTAMSSTSARIVYFSNTPYACAVAYPILGAQIPPVKTSSFTQFVSKLFSMQTTSANTLNAALQAEIGTTLMNTYNGIGSTGYASAQDIIFQSMVIRQMNESVVNFASANGGQSALLNLSIAQSEAQAKNQWLIGGELAKKYLPMFRGMIEGFIYGLFPIALLMMLTPAGGGFIKLYILALIWVHSWSPLYAILNHYIQIYAAKAIAGGPGLTMVTYSSINSGAQDMLAVLGIMGSTIPMVALALVKGGSMGVEAMMSAASSEMSGAARDGGRIATSGNLSLGNASVGNTSFQNHSAFQNNHGFSWSQGNSFSDNNNVRSFNAGDNYSQGSNPGMGLNYKNTLSSQISHEKGIAASQRESHTASAANKLAAVSQQIVASEQSANHGVSVGSGSSENTSAKDKSSVHKGMDATERFMQEIGGSKDQAHQVMANYTANAKAGISVPLGKLVGLNASAGVGEDSKVSDANNSKYKEAYKKYQESMGKIGVNNIINEETAWAKSHNENTTDATNDGSRNSISASKDDIDSEIKEASNAYSREQKLGEMESQVNRSSREITENSSWAVNKAAQEMGMDGQTLNRVIMDNANPVKAQIYQRAEQLAAGNYIEQHLKDNVSDGEYGKLNQMAQGGNIPTPGTPQNPVGGSVDQNFTDGKAEAKADGSSHGVDFMTEQKKVLAEKNKIQGGVNFNMDKTQEKIDAGFENAHSTHQGTGKTVNQGIENNKGQTAVLNGTPVITGLEAFRSGEQWASRHTTDALSVTPEQREKVYEANATQVGSARNNEGISTGPPGHLGEKTEELNQASEARKKEMEEAKK